MRCPPTALASTCIDWVANIREPVLCQICLRLRRMRMRLRRKS